MVRKLCVWALGLLVMVATVPVQAQPDCGVVDNITYPIDTNTFVLVQDYGAASARHQGRFHTGEDWYGGRDQTVGQPVRAAAKGRVTYSFAQGWGRDGGVVIIEHVLPDGEVFYTQYGHMMATETYPFPTGLACVAQGQVIGAIGDVRPAPHLHFEVRVANPTRPGAGYTAALPFAEGYRDPSKFITNLQAWLHPAHVWHINTGNETPRDAYGPLSPPFVLDDNSVLYLDSGGLTLRRATPDGRVLWRQRFDTPALSVRGFQGNAVLTFADGSTHRVDISDGRTSELWALETQLTGAPFRAGAWLIFPAAGDALVAVDEVQQRLVWRVEGIPPFKRAHVLGDGSDLRLALLTADDVLIYLAGDGRSITQAQLREAGSFGTTPQGDLLAYTRGGLWQIDADGDWSLAIEDVAGGGDRGALLTTETAWYLFDGLRLMSYAPAGVLQWQTAVPNVRGAVELALHDELILLTSNHGNIALVSTGLGRFCNQLQIFGTATARQWHRLNADGVLRLAVADQIIGFDWAALARPCRS